MKKIYIFLLVTSNSLSTSCMEQLKKPFPSTHYGSTNASLQNSNLFTCNTIPENQEISQPTTMLNMPELTPIYIPNNPNNPNKYTASTKKSIQYNEKMPLLQTVPTTTHFALKEKLYNDTYTFIYNAYNNNELPSWMHHYKTLAHIINSMKKARKKGINEDIMGKFSYNKQQPESAIGPLIYEDNKNKVCTTLFFNCLKRYRLSTQKTKEALPFLLNNKQHSLTEIFTLTSDINKQNNAYNSKMNPLDYRTFTTTPAFMYLEYVTRDIQKLYDHKTIAYLTTCLYSKQQQSLQPKEPYKGLELKNQFYDKAYRVLFNNNTITDLYNLLEFVDAAKKAKDIDDENNLAYGIIGFNLPQSINHKMHQCWNEHYFTTHTKNRITLLCALLKKYNDTRRKKINPTNTQQLAYRLLKDCNLAVPQSWKCAYLSNKYYAFVELTELIQNIKILKQASNTEIQNNITTLYPQTIGLKPLESVSNNSKIKRV